MGLHSVERDWQYTAETIGVTPHIKARLEATLGQLDAHHSATADHSKRVGTLAARIGLHQNLSPKPLFYGGSLHDRGKLLVRLALLDKTGEWTSQDVAALTSHPLDGYHACLSEGMVVTAGLVVRHRSFQPHSYPADIPPAPPYMQASFSRCARIISLADFYDASHRKNSASNLANGQDIKEKVLSHNPDEQELVHALYADGVFTTELE